MIPLYQVPPALYTLALVPDLGVQALADPEAVGQLEERERDAGAALDDAASVALESGSGPGSHALPGRLAGAQDASRMAE